MESTSLATSRDERVEALRLLQDLSVDPHTFVPCGESQQQPARSHDAVTSLDTPGLGLTIGQSAPLACLGLLGDLMTHALTLRGAIGELLQCETRLLSGRRFRLREDGSQAWLSYAPPFRAPQIARLCSEMTFAFALRIARVFAPDARIQTLSLRGPAPSYSERLRRFFGCDVRCEALRDELCFPSSLLDRQHPFADPELYLLYKRHAERVLRADRKHDPLHTRVKEVLRHEVDLGFVKAPPIAQRLGVSPRAFRRRLSIEGHSLSALADEVRRELSLEALVAANVPIKQIADRVGFCEVSAFHRAFKRWTGMTPARYRAEAMASDCVIPSANGRALAGTELGSCPSSA